MKYRSLGFYYVALTAISEWSHAFNTGITVQEKLFYLNMMWNRNPVIAVTDGQAVDWMLEFDAFVSFRGFSLLSCSKG
jgi:hypothetical protein